MKLLMLLFKKRMIKFVSGPTTFALPDVFSILVACHSNWLLELIGAALLYWIVIIT